MIKELVLLKRLQEIDQKIMELEAEKGDLPEQLEKLNQEIHEFEGEIRKSAIKREEIESDKIQQEQTLRIAQDQLKKSQSTIFSVKTTREYDAISLEIEQTKQTISECERIQLELMVQDDEIVLHQNDLLEKLSAFKTEYEERNNEMKEQTDSHLEEFQTLKSQRDNLEVKIKVPVLSHYKRIRKIRDGVGVSVMTGNACGYCSAMIPPQRQAEVRRGDDVLLCEVCGCYLVAELEN